ncbi:hypothetical protein HDV04_004851 [Boothiomyces sp. JEL0838]|nr:hypothetical protein HDV04_004851 [Boothiomyces sp. JEL0838]
MQFQSEYYRLLDLLQIELTNEIIAEVVTLYDKLIDSTTPKTVFVVTNKLLSNTKFSSTCPITLLIARHLPRLLDNATKAMENETGLSIYHYFLSNLFRFKGIDYYLSDFLKKTTNDSDKITIGLEYIKGCFGLNVNSEYINDVVAHRLQDLDCHSLHQIVTIYATLHQRQDQAMMTPSLLKAIVDVWYVKYILKSEKFTIPEDWWVIFPFLYAQSNQSLYISQFTSVLTLKYFYQLLENECNSMVLDTSPTALHLTSNEFAFFQFAEMDWLSIYKNSGMYQTETIVIFCGVSKIYLKQHSTAKDIILCRLAQLVPDIYASPNIWKPCLSIINETLSLTGNAVFAVDYTALGFDCLHRIQSLIRVLQAITQGAGPRVPNVL